MTEIALVHENRDQVRENRRKRKILDSARTMLLGIHAPSEFGDVAVVVRDKKFVVRSRNKLGDRTGCCVGPQYCYGEIRNAHDGYIGFGVGRGRCAGLRAW